MGIYWYAADESEKKIIEPPSGFATKTPGLYHQENPFPGMVCMMNTRGYHYEIQNDMQSFYDYQCTWENITDQVYKEYLESFK